MSSCRAFFAAGVAGGGGGNGYLWDGIRYGVAKPVAEPSSACFCAAHAMSSAVLQLMPFPHAALAGTLLAYAGLRRLEMAHVATAVLGPEVILLRIVVVAGLIGEEGLCCDARSFEFVVGTASFVFLMVVFEIAVGEVIPRLSQEPTLGMMPTAMRSREPSRRLLPGVESCVRVVARRELEFEAQLET